MVIVMKCRAIAATRPRRNCDISGPLCLALTAILLLMSAMRLLAEDRPLDALFAVLDGAVFEARIVPDDGAAETADPLMDRLSFDGGMLVSEICAEYDFAPAQYWVRTDDGAIRFYSEMHSPTSGVMVWTGAIKDGALSGTMRWRRDRWYRSIDATHRIEGRLVSRPTE